MHEGAYNDDDDVDNLGYGAIVGHLRAIEEEERAGTAEAACSRSDQCRKRKTRGASRCRLQAAGQSEARAMSWDAVRNNPWTDERVERLKVLWVQGDFSASQIANLLGDDDAERGDRQSPSPRSC
jgi:hypothetical protein